MKTFIPVYASHIDDLRGRSPAYRGLALFEFVQVHLTTLYISSPIKLLPVSKKKAYEKLTQKYLDNILLIEKSGYQTAKK